MSVLIIIIYKYFHYSVKSLSLNHEIIALHIKSILEKAQEERKKQNKGPDSIVEIEYNSNLHNAKPQRIKVTHKTYLSPQWSLFKNYDHDENNLTEDDLMCWKDESTIENIETGISILVGGNSSSGVVKYIEKYGFYEGGLLNEYRIDPRILYSIITGHLNDDVYHILISKIEAKEKVIYNDYIHEKQQILSLSNEMSEIEMNTYLKSLEKRYKDDIETYKKKRDHLSNVFNIKI